MSDLKNQAEDGQATDAQIETLVLKDLRLTARASPTML